jgi:hypothetical protein
VDFADVARRAQVANNLAVLHYANQQAYIDKLMESLQRRHLERSYAQSKDPEELRFGFAAGFLDFARNDEVSFTPWAKQLKK